MTRAKFMVRRADVEIAGNALIVPVLLRRDVVSPDSHTYVYETVTIPINAAGAERLHALIDNLRVAALSDCVGRSVLLVYRDGAVPDESPVALVTLDAEGRETAEIPLTHEVTP